MLGEKQSRAAWDVWRYALISCPIGPAWQPFMILGKGFKESQVPHFSGYRKEGMRNRETRLPYENHLLKTGSIQHGQWQAERKGVKSNLSMNGDLWRYALISCPIRPELIFSRLFSRRRIVMLTLPRKPASRLHGNSLWGGLNVHQTTNKRISNTTLVS
jgi:hypothetical protein